ncbi:MAG TPA: sigma-70 family RNA polymerase sigma factor [Candidatus Elarobacter sp.]
MTAEEREQRIRELLPLVRQLARRVHRMIPSADVDDLIGDGHVGAIRVVDAFDPALGGEIERYAQPVILGAMLNGVRRLDPVSERVRRTIRHAERARFALAQELGALPTPTEMDGLVPGLARARTEAHRGTPLSLDVTLPLGEHLALDRENDPQAIVARTLRRDAVRRAIAALPERQRVIVLAHYIEERSLRSIHRTMQISPQRVSQLHLAAMRRLRAALAETA